ncbi:MAG: hypothetical protein ACLFMZ_05790 [Spirochaetaceae bacterium]
MRRAGIIQVFRITLLAFFVLGGTLLYGETAETTEKEEEQFEAAFSEVENLQEGLKEKEAQIVENAPLSEEVIDNIFRAYIHNNRGLLDIASEDEKEIFSRVMEDVFEVQKEYRKRIAEAIDEHGFEERDFYSLCREHKYEEPKEEPLQAGFDGGIDIQVEPIGSHSNRIPGTVER